VSFTIFNTKEILMRSNPRKIRKGNRVKILLSTNKETAKVLKVEKNIAHLSNDLMAFKKWNVAILERVNKRVIKKIS
jgi:hypothetical protein